MKFNLPIHELLAKSIFAAFSAFLLSGQAGSLHAQSECCSTTCDTLSCDSIAGYDDCYDSCDGLACSPFSCGFCDGENLFGDWLGVKPHLAESGITVDAMLTQFHQGVTQGGGEQRFRYGSKMDAFVNIDTGKIGLWEGGLITSHVTDWQFGQSSIADAVGLAPVNTALLTPKVGEPSYAVTSLQYTHQLGDGWAATLGRMNLLDLWVGFYPQYGRGIDGFMNTSVLLPLSTIPSIPLINNAAGILKAGDRGVEAGFFVLESQHSPTTVGMDFPNGVTLLAVGRQYTDFRGKPGSHTLLGSYATGDYTSFDLQGWAVLPEGGVEPAEKSGTWAAMYLGEQQLWSDSNNPNRYTSMFGYVGFSDDETSPFRWTGSLSVESFGPIACRPADRTGIAYFCNGLNDDFQNVFSLVSPLDDIHGGEVYYNAAITPWFHLTFDVQVIDPAIEARDTAVVLGTRAKIDF
ncbi:Carbohydrate-selective porin, OprB family [Planctomycetes bacterium CA13]|uniref:Carbohydrate-selective porin, OprB family n=1 Tax=Novipirellula herctigrandis TaxID=2527986 RepID=A0A5C5Z353_9BACT|nr:Carbohydrate-selective porin, OprB family [Planctomycetes bacterium CA13]